MSKIKSYITIILIMMILSMIPVASAQSINIEYFYQPECHDCELTEPIIEQIEKQNNNVIINKTNVNTVEGFEKWKKYDFYDVPSIVINDEIKISRVDITEEKLQYVIDTHTNVNYTVNQTINQTNDRPMNIILAYTLGLFAGMSPCLMAILGFLLSFTASTSDSIHDGMTRAMIFGVGLVVSYITIGIMLITFKRSIPDFTAFSIITGFIVIGMGLYFIGIVELPISTEKYFHTIARKHVHTVSGLFLLGMLFSFVKVPCTLPMLLVLLNGSVINGTVKDISMLFIFSMGVLTPFIGVGLIGGYTLSKRIRDYRSQIKMLSGFILIFVGGWLLLA
ncbi:cytochrome c biogenesis protein CcdA [Methanomethylovorans sp.]|uniref:urease accessory protein UreH domain-containing protein n=1 Tax=Methanomethylovorans sp. TaxID=2758717 RepID=UPI003D0FF72E